jgi:hypothetical protein
MDEHEAEAIKRQHRGNIEPFASGPLADMSFEAGDDDEGWENSRRLGGGTARFIDEIVTSPGPGHFRGLESTIAGNTVFSRDGVHAPTEFANSPKISFGRAHFLGQ